MAEGDEDYKESTVGRVDRREKKRARGSVKDEVGVQVKPIEVEKKQAISSGVRIEFPP